MATTTADLLASKVITACNAAIAALPGLIASGGQYGATAAYIK